MNDPSNNLYSNQLLQKFIFDILRAKKSYKHIIKVADGLRKKTKGDDIHLRGLIECSNICQNDCLYCGIRKSNKNIERYRMTEAEIVELATEAVHYGFKTIVLQSGEDSYYDQDKVSYIVKNIKKLDVAITLSMGEKSFDEYQAYKDAGADRYLLKIETTDNKLYHKLNPNMSLENRQRCLIDLKKIGFEVGSGILIGLPDQSISSITDDLLFLKELNIDMAGIGPFISHPDTPLKDAPNGDFDLALVTMSLMRLLLPNINITATTAMETLKPNGQELALNAGANVFMPNITRTKYKKLYELYPRKNKDDLTLKECRLQAEAKIRKLGRTLGTSQGNHI